MALRHYAAPALGLIPLIFTPLLPALLLEVTRGIMPFSRDGASLTKEMIFEDFMVRNQSNKQD